MTFHGQGTRRAAWVLVAVALSGCQVVKKAAEQVAEWTEQKAAPAAQVASRYGKDSALAPASASPANPPAVATLAPAAAGPSSSAPPQRAAPAQPGFGANPFDAGSARTNEPANRRTTPIHQPPAEPEIKPGQVTIPNFTRFAIKQEKPVWCWAACAEMIHRYHGETRLTQRVLAQRIIGRAEINPDAGGTDVVKTAQQEEVLAALSPRVWEMLERRDERRQTSKSRQKQADGWRVNYIALFVGPMLRYDPEEMIRSLEAGEPAVVAFGRPSKHVCVVYAATFERKKEKGLFGLSRDVCEVKSVTVLDPWEGQPEVIDGASFKTRVDFVATVGNAVTYLNEAAEYDKIPFFVNKRAKGPLIEQDDVWEAMKRASEIQTKVRGGGKL